MQEIISLPNEVAFAPPDQSLRFSSNDGTELYGEWFACTEKQTNQKGSALVLHGYAEHCGRYREVARTLAGAGYNVFTFDMRGHGKSAGARGYVDSFDDYLNDATAARVELDRLAGPTKNHLLFGHSNGGLTALAMLIDSARWPSFDRAILTSPFLQMRLAVSGVKKFMGRIASRFAPKTNLGNQLDAELLTSCPERQRAREQDELCNNTANVRWFTEAEKTWDAVRTGAAKISIPTLWLVAGDDQIADPSASEAIAKAVSGPCEFHLLAGMQHEVVNERERGKVLTLLANFSEKSA